MTTDNVVPFRTANGLTQAEVSTTVAALRMSFGASAVITTHTTEDGDRSIAVSCRNDDGYLTRGLCREDGWYAMFDSVGESIVESRDLNVLLEHLVRS